MFFPVEEWFAAFLLTIVVEVPIVVVMLRRSEPDLARLVGIAFFANLASHPAVWFVFTQLFLVGTPEYLVAAEGWAVVVEAVFYVVVIRGVSLPRALAVSLVANGASFAVGRLIGQAWLGVLR
jgi:hypothetical protein